MASTWPFMSWQATRCASSPISFTLWQAVGLALVVVPWAVGTRSAVGCPFCPTLPATWSQRCAVATQWGWGEVVALPSGGIQLRLRQVVRGASLAGGGPRTVELPSGFAARSGALALAWGNVADEGGAAPSAQPALGGDALVWEVEVLSEVALGYVLRAPAEDRPTSERLTYFARYLEHRDAAIASDAYAEFARASFDEVRAVESLDAVRLREWLADNAVPAERKGLYGLCLGWVGGATERDRNLQALLAVVDAPASDFRRGFDGVLAGLMLAGGEAGLDIVANHFLGAPQAADGDVRHALTAVRFYEQIAQGDLQEWVQHSVRPLLWRPEFAPDAIVDLARWQDTAVLEEVVACYAQPGYPQPATRRAVVGYLRALDQHDALASLRRQDPAGVAAAEADLERLPVVR